MLLRQPAAGHPARRPLAPDRYGVPGDHNLRPLHYGEAGKGGHFAALEQPEILVSEIRTGLRTLRS